VALTLEDALERARAQAPGLRAAHAELAQAEARARVPRLEANPVLEGAVGDRRTADRAPHDFSFGLSQELALGGRLGARRALADANVERSRAALAEALDRALREAALAYFRALQAGERVQVAEQVKADGDALLEAAERRFAAGDVAALDVNAARAAAARARADARAAEAARSGALGELGVLIGVEPRSELRLAPRPVPATPPALDELLAAAESRPDLRAAAAAVLESDAEGRLGRALAWPTVTLLGRYEREERRDVLWAGVALALPFWNRGRPERAAAAARASATRGQRAQLGVRARVEVETALAVYAARRGAVDALAEALPAVAENERLARRSYEEGQTGLPDVLLIRREGIELREALLQRRLEADEAWVELQSRAGVLR
jgi:cobalt-zinc-cadmium efflux system outer membrane protein